ncbi:hypothetical protein Tco_1518169, partial [Tanacetum coccineum]
IYAKNHYKSLDHRSFYFKQQDSKDLSNVSPKRVDSSKVIMVNGGTLPKEDGSRVEKDVKNTGIRDKALAVGVVNDNVLPRSSTELSGRDATPRPHNVHDDGHKAKSNIDDQGDTSRTPPVANRNFAKFEKEEGELSHNLYFDELIWLHMEILASSLEVPSVLEFLQRRKLEAKKYYLNWSNGLSNG